jgi:HSF-type DNA-binding
MRSRQSSSDSSRSKSGGSCEFEAVRTSSKTPSTAKNMLRSSSIKRTRTSLTAADQAYQQKKPPSKGIPELDMSLPFPAKLHYIISNPKYNDYINWCPHGRAWKVLKQTEFERYIIPIFFRSDKFASFMRQVRKAESNRSRFFVGLCDQTLFSYDHTITTTAPRSMVGRLSGWPRAPMPIATITR